MKEMGGSWMVRNKLHFYFLKKCLHKNSSPAPLFPYSILIFISTNLIHNFSQIFPLLSSPSLPPYVVHLQPFANLLGQYNYLIHRPFPSFPFRSDP